VHATSATIAVSVSISHDDDDVSMDYITVVSMSAVRMFTVT
jgi:hypothetical protein